MAEVKVEQREPTQIGRPGPVYISLIDSDGNIKARVDIFPKFEKPPFSDDFVLVVNKTKSMLAVDRTEIRLIL